MGNNSDTFTEFVGRMVMWGLKLGGGLGFGFVVVFFLILPLFSTYSAFTFNNPLIVLAGIVFYGFLIVVLGAMVGASIGLLLGSLIALLIRVYSCFTETHGSTQKGI